MQWPSVWSAQKTWNSLRTSLFLLCPKYGAPLDWVFKAISFKSSSNRLPPSRHPLLSMQALLSLSTTSASYFSSNLLSSLLPEPLVKHPLPWLPSPAGWSPGFLIWSLQAWTHLTRAALRLCILARSWAPVTPAPDRAEFSLPLPQGYPGTFSLEVGI